MGMVRIVLTEPVYRYPMGTVFDLLQEKMEVEGWDPDERVRERMSFLNKEVFFLPDTGRGFGATLPRNATKPCPEAAFEGVDLHTGPLRITKATSGYGRMLQPEPAPLSCGNLKEEQATLLEIGGHTAQGLKIELPPFSKEPRQVTLREVQLEETLWEKPFSDLEPDSTTVTLDFSSLLPGFYQLFFKFRDDCRHSVQFVKSFPLRVEFDQVWGKYSVHKTLY